MNGIFIFIKVTDPVITKLISTSTLCTVQMHQPSITKPKAYGLGKK